MAEPGVSGRVLVAFGDTATAPSPTWTRIDDDTNDRVAQITITTGRQSEFDKTETGHATVLIHDVDGTWDQNNSGSPYFGTLNGKQILIQLYNPVLASWHSRFRGIIDEIVYDIHPATRSGVSILADVEINCVDIFDYLAGGEFVPGVHGDAGMDGAEAQVIYAEEGVDDRQIAILTNAAVDTTRWVVFSGNVNCQETKYDPGDSFLVALSDAADAESPAALANRYCDRFGRYVFHGRQSRIDPDAVIAAGGPLSTDTWDYKHWKIGDGAAITGDATYAQVRPPMQYRVSRNRIVNSALVSPHVLDPDSRYTIPAQVVSDFTSITNNGYHSFNFLDSINAGHKTNGDTAEEDCGRSAQFLVDNFANPIIRIEALTVKSLRPTDARAAATWLVLCRSDISDKVTVAVDYPGGTGIAAADYFIEGWTQTITPLQPGYDMVELSLNVSPVPIDGTAYDDTI